MNFKYSVIAGFGNPGEDYENTRHNAGFNFIDFLAEELSFPAFELFKPDILFSKKDGVILVKPQSFMNRSGEALLKFMTKMELSILDLCVVYDDVDLPLGHFRFRTAGSAGTHNGMRSLIAAFKTQELARLRLGIENREEAQKEHQPLADFVLEKFKKEELKLLRACFSAAMESMKTS